MQRPEEGGGCHGAGAPMARKIVVERSQTVGHWEDISFLSEWNAVFKYRSIMSNWLGFLKCTLDFKRLAGSGCLVC